MGKILFRGGDEAMREAVGMIRTCLFLRREQLQDLREIGLETGAPVSFTIRRAIDALLAREAALAGRSHPGASVACEPAVETEGA